MIVLSQFIELAPLASTVSAATGPHSSMLTNVFLGPQPPPHRRPSPTILVLNYIPRRRAHPTVTGGVRMPRGLCGLCTLQKELSSARSSLPNICGECCHGCRRSRICGVFGMKSGIDPTAHLIQYAGLSDTVPQSPHTPCLHTCYACPHRHGLQRPIALTLSVPTSAFVNTLRVVLRPWCGLWHPSVPSTLR